MKKIFYVFLIVIIFASINVAAFADNIFDKINKDSLGEILNNVLIDVLQKNGMGDLIPGTKSSDNGPQTENKLPKVSKTSGKVTELSKEQFQSFSEICLAGSIEEFRKKIEYENISPEAKYTKEDKSVVTLLELAKTSPNPELAEFLNEMNETKGE